MTAALPLWALDTGQVEPVGAGDAFEIDIFNTNTGVTAGSRMRIAADGRFVAAEIPGVDGAFPGVDLFLANPVGAKTGRLLPTGRPVDEVAGYAVSCVDVAVPMVIARAADFGKTAHEKIEELEADRDFMAALRAVWVEAGLRMALKGAGGRPMTADRTRAERDDPEGVHRRAAAGRRPHRRALFHAADGASIDGGVRRLLPGGGGADPGFRRARDRAWPAVRWCRCSARSMSGSRTRPACWKRPSRRG